MGKQGNAKPLTNMELSFFCSQVAMTLRSGISSIEGITIMLEDAASEQEKSILQQILDHLLSTSDLSASLAVTGLFPPYLLHMVSIGEETGTLDEVMEALAVHYEREASIKSAVKNALTYPLIMIGMMLAVILILIVKVMPVFNQVFIQLGTELSGFSRALMNAGTLISRYSLLFLVLFAAAAGAVFYLTVTVKGKEKLRCLAYRLSATRPAMESLAACRFASGMALTLSSGLNPERCLELTAALNDDPFFKEKLDACSKLVEDGTDMAAAFSRAGIFTGMYARMISLGHKTGSMDQVLKKIAGMYQEEIDNRINRALSILEPTLVIGLSLIVGVILLSVMLPLMGIMSGL